MSAKLLKSVGDLSRLNLINYEIVRQKLFTKDDVEVKAMKELPINKVLNAFDLRSLLFLLILESFFRKTRKTTACCFFVRICYHLRIKKILNGKMYR